MIMTKRLDVLRVILKCCSAFLFRDWGIPAN